MLQQILIRNFALIEEMTLPFHGGLTVLTGETGAGKSIVVDAVSVILGGKADKDMVRSGAQKAYLEGTFSISDNPAARACLEEQELAAGEDELVLSREIALNGRSVCRVNGVLVSLGALKTLAMHVMEIHGQHDHQALLSDENHIGFLDMLGDEAYRGQLEELAARHAEFVRQRRAYEQAVGDAEHRQERLERLHKQRAEIANARLLKGEEEELVQRRDVLRHADKIHRALQAVYENLMEGEADALSLVRAAGREIKTVVGIGAQYAELDARLESLYYELEDIGLTAHRLHASVAADGDDLESIEDRLDLIRKLEKKYGLTVADVLDKLASVQEEISRLEELDTSMETLLQNAEKARKDYFDLAGRVSEARRKLAAETERSIDRELRELNMKGARFIVETETRPAFASAKGIDRLRFLIAPNAGEEAKPLSKTASGGELSRIMLAIKAASARRTMVPSMVFDEVDTGISGQTAAVVAEKMWSIARGHQVICVTHLQQIAAMASSQAVVQKREEKGRTVTAVRYLDEAGRVEELTRLIGETRDGGESGQKHAVSMLRDAERFRKQTLLSGS